MLCGKGDSEDVFGRNDENNGGVVNVLNGIVDVIVNDEVVADDGAILGSKRFKVSDK